jgi:hypothetical protein
MAWARPSDQTATLRCPAGRRGSLRSIWWGGGHAAGYRVRQGVVVVVMGLALTPLCHIAAAASLVPLIWGVGPRTVGPVDLRHAGAEEG